MKFISLFSHVEQAHAHVGYVVPKETMESVAGNDWNYLFSALTKENIYLMVGVFVVLLLFIIFIPKMNLWKKFSQSVESRVSTYGDFLPWMARLSIGILLMGAGTAGVFFSPVDLAFSPIPFIEILFGFFFLIGFLLIPITVGTIALFILALSDTNYLIGNLDILGLLFAFLALHSERPGVDDIFNLKVFYSLRFPRKLASLFLRLGIGTAMIYLALYEKILNPIFSDVVVKNYDLQGVINVSAPMWVLSVGLIEILVGLCLLIGYYTRLVSIVAFAILSLSFFYFKEDVYSHVSLFGVLSMLFVLGGGYLSRDEWIKKRKTQNLVASQSTL